MDEEKSEQNVFASPGMRNISSCFFHGKPHVKRQSNRGFLSNVFLTDF